VVCFIWLCKQPRPKESSLWETLDVVQQLRIVRRTKTSYRAPSVPATITISANSSNGTLVVTSVDCVVGSGVDLSGLVEHGVQETQRLLTGIESVVVQQGDNTSNDGCGSRSTSSNSKRTRLDGQDSGTKGGDVRVTTVSGVEPLGGRDQSAGGQVLLDGRGLPRGHGGILGETASGGPLVISFVGHARMLKSTTIATSASVTLVANGGRVGDGVAANEGGTADGSYPGGSSGIDGPQRMAVIQLATFVGFRRSSFILRSNQHTQTKTGNLKKFVVGLSNILAGSDTSAVAVGYAVALIFLGPAVGDGVDKRRVGGVEQSQSEIVDPTFNGDIPSEGTSAKCGQVFNIKNGLTVISDIEGTNNLGDVGEDFVGLLSEGNHVRDERGTLRGELDGRLAALGVGGLAASRDAIKSPGGGRDDIIEGVFRVGVDGFSLLRANNRELGDTRNELQMFGKIAPNSRESTLQMTTNNLETRLLVLVDGSLNVQELLSTSNGGDNLDGITKVFELGGVALTFRLNPRNVLQGDFSGGSNQLQNLFLAQPVAVLGVSGVRDLENDPLQLVDVPLLQSEGKGYTVSWSGRLAMKSPS